MTKTNIGITDLEKATLVGEVDNALVLYKNATLADNIDYLHGEDGSEYYDNLSDELKALFATPTRENIDIIFNSIDTEQASIDRISQIKGIEVL